MNKLSMLLPVIFVAGCATGYAPSYYFNQVQVINLSGGSISQVDLRVIDSNRVLSCDQVNKNAICNERFGKRRYPQAGIELSWIHPDGTQKSETLSPPVPVTFFNGLPLQIMLEILSDGSVKPYYRQEEPGRNGSLFLGS